MRSFDSPIKMPISLAQVLLNLRMVLTLGGEDLKIEVRQSWILSSDLKSACKID